MANAYVKVEGAKELEARMKALPEKVSKKLAKKALREGCKILQKQAKADVPVKSGKTKKLIRIKVGRARKGSVSVMVAIGKRMYEGDAFYAAFVEFGWFLGKRLRGTFRGKEGRQRYHDESVKAGRRFIPGKHFMEGAYEKKHDEAAAKAEETLKADIIKEATG